MILTEIGSPGEGFLNDGIWVCTEVDLSVPVPLAVEGWLQQLLCIRGVDRSPGGSQCTSAMEAQMSLSRTFTGFAEHVAHATGKPVTFAPCVLVVLLWAVTGPLFHFSDAWQLVIN